MLAKIVKTNYSKQGGTQTVCPKPSGGTVRSGVEVWGEGTFRSNRPENGNGSHYENQLVANPKPINKTKTTPESREGTVDIGRVNPDHDI